MTAIIFGADVALADGVVKVGGFHAAIDEPMVAQLLVQTTGLLASRALIEVDKVHEAGGRWRSDLAWSQLRGFEDEGHPHDPRLFLDSTQVRFVAAGSLSETEGRLGGALISSNEGRIEQLIVNHGGAMVLLPFDVAVLQSRRWIYVDAARYPVRTLARYDVEASSGL